MEEAKAEQLRKRIAASTGDTLDRQEELLRQLNKEVSTTLGRLARAVAEGPAPSHAEGAAEDSKIFSEPLARGRSSIFSPGKHDFEDTRARITRNQHFPRAVDSPDDKQAYSIKITVLTTDSVPPIEELKAVRGKKNHFFWQTLPWDR